MDKKYETCKQIHISNIQYRFTFLYIGKVIVHPYMIEPRHQFSQPKMYNIHQIEPVLTSEAVYNITHGIEGQYSSKLASSTLVHHIFRVKFLLLILHIRLFTITPHINETVIGIIVSLAFIYCNHSPLKKI